MHKAQCSRGNWVGIKVGVEVLCAAQEFLICVEMFVAALAHAYAFPPRDYADPLHPPQSMVRWNP